MSVEKKEKRKVKKKKKKRTQDMYIEQYIEVPCKSHDEELIFQTAMKRLDQSLSMFIDSVKNNMHARG